MLVTDFTHLNCYVKRPVHPFPSTLIPHHFPPSARKIPVFRAPMGLNASSNEWCWAKKIVDDTIIWAPTLGELRERANVVLQRCRDVNITISLKKLEMGKEYSFAGHIVSQAGIRPNDSKYRAIADFPTPENISQLRSFLGLANQLTAFAPDLAHMTATLRPLLKKGTAWVWTKDMQEDFQQVMLLLTTTTTVQPFNPSLESILMTDASRLFGIGFALLQPMPKEKWSLIQCGSASLTPTQTRYATIELECMAIQWAIQKCSYYLRGLPTFEVWTDHKPLVGIFTKNICDLQNPRLMRMREKIMEYTPIVKWVPGKTHYIADDLSRSPMFNTNEDEHTISCNYQSVQSAWDHIKEGTKSAHYAALQKAVEPGEPNVEISQFKTLLHRLSIRRIEDVDMAILNSTRLVIPTSSQKTVLTELHRAHSGITKT